MERNYQECPRCKKPSIPEQIRRYTSEERMCQIKPTYVRFWNCSNSSCYFQQEESHMRKEDFFRNKPPAEMTLEELKELIDERISLSKK